MKKDIEQKTANETKHTPGEWVAAGESIITKDDKHCIAVIESDGGYEAPPEQREANAHLIAAAPDLLAALELITESFASHFPYGIEVTTSRAALAKARGEKS